MNISNKCYAIGGPKMSGNFVRERNVLFTYIIYIYTRSYYRKGSAAVHLHLNHTN